MNASFHLALPVINITKTEFFYVTVLGCSTGRKKSNWIDINFFGNQITFMHSPELVNIDKGFYEKEDRVPTVHFGAIVALNDWNNLLEKLKKHSVQLLIKPRTMFHGEVGEQQSFFVRDPNGYAIEFKSFDDTENIFKS